MTNAIRHVHRKNGLWVTEGGVEYPVVVLAALAALADGGPGRFSLDEVLGIRLRGPVVTAIAMGAGAAGAVYVAERGQQLFDSLAADEALSRSAETVGAESLARAELAEQALGVPVLPALLARLGRVVAVELDERVDEMAAHGRRAEQLRQLGERRAASRRTRTPSRDRRRRRSDRRRGASRRPRAGDRRRLSGRPCPAILAHTRRLTALPPPEECPPVKHIREATWRTRSSGSSTA